MSNCSESRVFEFYRESTVLLAGGTGFLGKTLLEKVLRCLEVSKIYLLIRTKKGCCAEERLKKILADRLFDRVRNPELIAKIIPVDVDYEQEDFGLTSGLKSQIQKEVQMVLYCIATVRLIAPLKEIVETNVFLTRRMLQWFRTFSRLKTCVYTSTFFCNVDKEICEEKVYRDLPFGSYEIVMNMLKQLSVEECEQLKSAIMQKFPNAYIFSKRLAEIMIETEFRQTLPVAIYRPPVISPTYREPLTGWTDNTFGTVAYIKSFWDGLGMVKYFNKRAKCDLAPVDYCASAVLVSGFDAVEKRLGGSGSRCIPVYNHHNNKTNNTYGELASWLGDSRTGVWERFVWKYCWFSTSHLWLMYVTVILAGIKDKIAVWRAGNKPIKKFYYRWSAYWFIGYSQMTGCVAFRSWKSVSHNLKRAQRYLSERDRQMFYFDLDEINFEEYIKCHVDGVIQYLAAKKQNISTN